MLPDFTDFSPQLMTCMDKFLEGFFYKHLSFKIAMYGRVGVGWLSDIVQGLPFG